MTTKFSSEKHCLEVIADALDVPLEEVEKAWSGAEEVHIDWPHNQDVKAFTVGEQQFAVSDFRDGKAIWTVLPEGMMLRW